MSTSIAVTYIFTAPTCTTTIITLEPCALNAEFQHFIPRFNKNFLPLGTSLKEGIGGWKEAQRQGEDWMTLRKTLISQRKQKYVFDNKLWITWSNWGGGSTGWNPKSQDENSPQVNKTGPKLVFPHPNWSFAPHFVAFLYSGSLFFIKSKALLKIRSCKSSELIPSFVKQCQVLLTLQIHTQSAQNRDYRVKLGSKASMTLG